MTSVLRRTSATTARTKPTTGDTKTSFVDTDHLGWLRCDGRALNKIAYNLLFGVIGYTFGGSGATFNLPDGRGRVVGNKGTVVDACNPGGVAFPSGWRDGEVTHRLTIAEMPSHNHNNLAGTPGASSTTQPGTTTLYGHDHGSNTGPGGSAAESETVVGSVTAVIHSNAIVAGSNNHTHAITNDIHSHTIASNGGDACHNNMQPTLFYGNMFIYGGIMLNDVYPYDTRPAPVLI